PPPELKCHTPSSARSTASLTAIVWPSPERRWPTGPTPSLMRMTCTKRSTRSAAAATRATMPSEDTSSLALKPCVSHHSFRRTGRATARSRTSRHCDDDQCAPTGRVVCGARNRRRHSARGQAHEEAAVAMQRAARWLTVEPSALRAADYRAFRARQDAHALPSALRISVLFAGWPRAREQVATLTRDAVAVEA